MSPDEEMVAVESLMGVGFSTFNGIHFTQEVMLMPRSKADELLAASKHFREKKKATHAAAPARSKE